MNILLGVTGSISAYKAASVVSVLHRQGHDVRVCMTKAATQFVGPATFSALSHQPVILDEDEWKPDGHIMHIEMAQEWAKVLVIAPASYDFIGKMVFARADDALSSICAAWPGATLVCPAMNTVMWKNLCTIEPFKSAVHWVHDVSLRPVQWHLPFPHTDSGVRQYVVLSPAVGRLACGAVGEGALRPTNDIVNFINGYAEWCYPNTMISLKPRE